MARSGDPDERLRALERASVIGTPEAILLLSSVLDLTSPMVRDARAKILAARGLAGHVDVPAARATLLAITTFNGTAGLQRASVPQRTASDPFGDEAEQSARLEAARRIAALALAESGDTRAVEGLLSIARGGGPGQTAAALALLAHPPASLASLASGTMSPAALRLLAELGDLRTLDAVRTAASALDVPTRAAALVALGALGDLRALDLARAAVTDGDVRLRVAAAAALVALDAPDRFAIVEAMVGEDATAMAGIRLAERVHAEGIARALAARAVAAADPAVRGAAIAALGRAPVEDAVRALLTLARDPLLAGDAAGALATSPAPSAMGAIEALASDPATRRLGVRAYVVRRSARAETSARAEAAVDVLARSGDARDRALAVFARIVGGDMDAGDALADRDVEVRRAAAVAALGDPRPKTRRARLSRIASEPDAATRQARAAALAGGDPDARVSTTELLERARSGDPDAPVAALAFTSRADDARGGEVLALLASRDPTVRAHAARGLATSPLASASGRLHDAYTFEADAAVRYAIVLAVALRGDDAAAARATLSLAQRLDPDARVRWTASRARALRDAARRGDLAATEVTSIAWLRLMTPEGGAPPPPLANVGSPAGAAAAITAALVRADGLAVPIVFDSDGYALVPGMPPGDARLLLAPSLPGAYEPPSR
jgi:HEAT repeat protein